jgi:ADP-ribosylglycohydrolase
MSKDEIKRYVQGAFGYKLSVPLDEIRPRYFYNAICQETVPQAIRCFLEADDFEKAVRLAVSLGGDSDTLACIAGSIAGAFYGVPRKIERRAMTFLDGHLRQVVVNFNEFLRARRPT